MIEEMKAKIAVNVWAGNDVLPGDIQEVELLFPVAPGQDEPVGLCLEPDDFIVLNASEEAPQPRSIDWEEEKAEGESREIPIENPTLYSICLKVHGVLIEMNDAFRSIIENEDSICTIFKREEDMAELKFIHKESYMSSLERERRHLLDLDTGIIDRLKQLREEKKRVLKTMDAKIDCYEKRSDAYSAALRLVRLRIEEEHTRQNKMKCEELKRQKAENQDD